MKPSWKDAPDWAKFVAMDGDERWYWYETKPEWDDQKNKYVTTGKYAATSNGTLEERPSEQ